MENDQKKQTRTIDLPTPTGWPIVCAFGLMLLFAGLVTNIVISFVGILLGFVAAVGWFLDVFPHPKHEAVPVRPPDGRPAPVRTASRVVQILDAGNIPHRARIPIEVHPYTVGIVGGLAGGFVMALLACTYGLVKYGSVWYPINLLAAAGVPELATASHTTLCQFSLAGFIVGFIAHWSMSILIGLLYVTLVPMLPRGYGWLWGGIVTPLLWTGLIFASLRMINPTLAANLDWPWFILCQVAFGAVCGFIVFKSGKVATMQNWTLAEKLGVEAQHETEDKK